MNFIEYHRNEISRLNHNITRLQICDNEYSLINSTFIIFNNAKSINVTCQSLVNSKSIIFNFQYIDVKLKNIIWQNLNIKWWQRLIRSLMIKFCVTILIEMWVLLIVFTKFLSQLNYVIVFWSTLQYLKKFLKLILNIIQKVVSQILLIRLTLLLSMFFRFLVEQQKIVYNWCCKICFSKLLLLIFIYSSIFYDVFIF